MSITSQDDMIGASLARPDARGKVTGETNYPADLVRPGMLHLATLFAGRPHARIVRIDFEPALAQPGVVAVLTAADVPFNKFGLIDADQPVLCDEKIRFTGDKVAVIVAETANAAHAALQHVVVVFDDIPSVTDPRAALLSSAPLVHESHGTNQLAHIPIRKGDIAVGFAEADVVLDGDFSTSWQEHAFLQPEAGIAYIDEADRVVIETAGQWLHEDRRQIAAMLRLPDERVVIRYAAIGGAFGGREDLSIQHLLALAAWKLRRPVAMVWSREESMIAHHKRHPMHVRCRWGVTKDGRITAVESEVIADGGAYASTSAEVVKVATLFASGCYEVHHISADGYAVYTNNVPSGAFRGFGAPQAQFAAEVMVTRLAQAIGMDPVELRRRNIYREGAIEPTQETLPAGVSALAVLDRCVEEVAARGWRRALTPQPPSPNNGRRGHSPSYEANPTASFSSYSPLLLGGLGGPEQEALIPKPPNPNNGHLWRGVGIACGMKNVGYSFGFPEQSTATVELFGRGEVERARVRIGAADVGQGSHLALRQIAAATLGIDFAAVEMVCDDSAEAPNAGSASASRLTRMAGRAVYDAVRAAQAKWPDTDDQRVEATVQYRPAVTTALDPVSGAGRPNYCYGYAAQAVEVEVNTLTGVVRVLRVISVHDVGRAINRQQVEGQIEGCLAQALGYALMEHFQSHDGLVLTPYFSTYLLPTSLDMPTEIIPVILELADPEGPFGARGVAEMPLVPFLPAVAAAIHDATGIWLTSQPFTPERVLTALQGREARGETTP
ncbi:MAG: xanthine dehydrogenase family protein molybdopterin-binding subunit [Chloroflexota bacterium]|nr:xanthine dehydrogenase family protein molybdopterin-binding subunit [Chloroflexota bacterium]